MADHYDTVLEGALRERKTEDDRNAALEAKRAKEAAEAQRAANERIHTIGSQWLALRGEQDRFLNAVNRRHDGLGMQIQAVDQPLQSKDVARIEWRIAFADGSLFKSILFVLTKSGCLQTWMDGRLILKSDILQLTPVHYAAGFGAFLQKLFASDKSDSLVRFATFSAS